MRSTFLLIVAVCALSVSICAQNKQYPADKHTATTNSDEPTHQLPALQQFNTERIPEEAAADKKRADEEASIKSREIDLTFFIAFAAFVQAGAAIWHGVIYRNQGREMKMQRGVMQDTLKAVNGQAEVMREQTEILKGSVAAAHQSAQAAIDQLQMMKRKERASITVVLPSDAPDFGTPFRFTEVEDDEQQFFMELPIAVQNHGPTKAFDVRAWAAMKTQPKDSPFVGDTMKAISIPDVIGEVSPDAPIHILTDDLLTTKESDEVNTAISDFYVYGEITYMDVFGDKRRTPFRFLWQVDSWEDDGRMEFSGAWINESPEPA